MRTDLGRVIVCLLCFTAIALAQESAPVDLGPDLGEILAAHDVPALGAARIQDGQVVAVGAVGLRARGRAAKVATDDLWHLGSCTKAMTASLCARLMATRDDLDAKDRLSRAFPDLEVHEDLADVTLPMLLSHRAGLVANPMMIWAELRRHPGPTTDARVLIARSVLTRRPQLDPGSRMLYSNTGYMIAGAWLEAVTGTGWEALMRTEVFEPLGMASAGFGPPGAADFDPDADSGPPPTQPWSHLGDGTPVAPGPDADNPPALGPAGTVHCTLADWAKFVIAHMDPADDEADRAPYLTGAQRRFLHTPPDDLAGYAMGWALEPLEDGSAALRHAGSNTMWFCIVRLVPHDRSAVLVCCNQGGDAAQAACVAALDALRAP